MSDAFFADGNARATLAALAAQPDAVLVSEETVTDYQLQPGDLINLRLQDARVSIDTAGKDDERREPSVVLPRHHLSRRRLIGAEHDMGRRLRWRRLHIEVTGNPGRLIRADRVLGGHSGSAPQDVA